MILKINSMYQSANGYIVPRSHFSEDKANQYCIVEELIGGGSHFVVSHKTMSKKELRKALGISGKEQIVIA